MKELLTIQVITRELVRLVLRELEFRVLTSGLVLEEGHKAGRNILGDIQEYNQLTVFLPYKTKDRQKSLELFSLEILAPLARELGIKLARPFPIKVYPMEVPKGVHEAAQESFNGVMIRGVTDYSIERDELLTRFDMLVKWDETAEQSEAEAA